MTLKELYERYPPDLPVMLWSVIARDYVPLEWGQVEYCESVWGPELRIDLEVPDTEDA